MLRIPWAPLLCSYGRLCHDGYHCRAPATHWAFCEEGLAMAVVNGKYLTNFHYCEKHAGVTRLRSHITIVRRDYK